jgi:hypothetical protein
MAEITADTQGLLTDGQGLMQTPTAPAASQGCAPAGADTVSVAAATSFSTWEAGLAALLGHSDAVRAAGGAAVAATGAVLDAAEADNAAAIASGNSTSGISGAALPASAALPPALPAAPAVPGVPEPATGEVWSAQIHGGPGSAPLRELASRLRSAGAHVQQLAEAARAHSSAIDEHWVDGRQRAGANVGALADWYDDASAYAGRLADAAATSADHVDTARAQTPTPVVFTKLQRRIGEGWNHYAATGDFFPLQAASTDMADAQRTAMEQHAVYAESMNAATGAVPAPPSPAPSIAKGGSEGPSDRQDPTTAKDRDDDDTKPGGGHLDDQESTEKGLIDKLDKDQLGLVDMRAADEPPGAGGPQVPDELPAEPPVPAAEPANPAGVPAEAAGTAVGQGLGQATQAAQGMPGMGQGGGMPGGMPTSALSALGSPSGLGGMPATPQMPSAEDMGLGNGFDPDDVGVGATEPSSIGGGGYDGAGLAGSAPSVSAPAAAPGAGMTGAASPPAGSAASAGGGAGGRMMGMVPPMMGAPGGANNAERDKDLQTDKRVVHREVPNSEPVFGELERQRQRRPRGRSTPEEGNDG